MNFRDTRSRQSAKLFLQSSESGLPQPLTCRRVWGRGGGGFQFQRGDRHCGILGIYVLWVLIAIFNFLNQILPRNRKPSKVTVSTKKRSYGFMEEMYICTIRNETENSDSKWLREWIFIVDIKIHKTTNFLKWNYLQKELRFIVWTAYLKKA